MRGGGFQSLGRAAGGAADRLGLQQRLAAELVARSWGRAAEAFVSGAARLSRAVRFEAGRLTVACLSRELAEQLRRFTRSIVGALNRQIGFAAVAELEFETL